jgi:hypothetical protein
MFKYRKYQIYFLKTISYLAYLVYFLILFGIINTKPIYLDTLQTGVQLYISIFLIIQFNPWIKRIHYDELDRKVAFSAGKFLLLTTFIGSIAKKYLESITANIKTKIETKIEKIKKAVV